MNRCGATTFVSNRVAKHGQSPRKSRHRHAPLAAEFYHFNPRPIKAVILAPLCPRYQRWREWALVGGREIRSYSTNAPAPGPRFKRRSLIINSIPQGRRSCRSTAVGFDPIVRGPLRPLPKFATLAGRATSSPKSHNSATVCYISRSSRPIT